MTTDSLIASNIHQIDAPLPLILPNGCGKQLRVLLYLFFPGGGIARYSHNGFDAAFWGGRQGGTGLPSQLPLARPGAVRDLAELARDCASTLLETAYTVPDRAIHQSAPRLYQYAALHPGFRRRPPVEHQSPHVSDL